MREEMTRTCAILENENVSWLHVVMRDAQSLVHKKQSMRQLQITRTKDGHVTDQKEWFREEHIRSEKRSGNKRRVKKRRGYKRRTQTFREEKW